MSNKRKYKHSAADISSMLAAADTPGRDLYHQALRLLGLQKRLAGMLGSPLDRHIAVAGAGAGILTVRADSSAWAARLRFKLPELLAGLPDGPDGITIQTIRIRVRPAAPPPGPSGTGERPAISPESARLLETVADSISDPDLSECLLRLSRHR